MHSWMGIALALVFLFAYRRPLWGRIPFNMVRDHKNCMQSLLS